MVGMAHDKLKIRIATIKRGDRGHATNRSVSWGKLRKRLGTPEKDEKHTLREYLDLPIDKQNRLKDVGSFVGGPFTEGLRRGTNLIERSIITLDIDVVADSQIELLRLGVSDACQYEFFGSTTRKHTRKKPRWRLVFPMTRPVEIEEYAPLARILASTLFTTVAESMDAVDDVSYRPAQVMYWPSVCRKALFETLHNPGELLDPDEVLENFGDWRDWTLLPYSEARGQKRPTTGEKAQDPTEKSGIVGAFCRAYSVPEAIDEFLSDKYVPGDPNSSKPRYTYVHGSSSNGAIVEDDGLFLYSHHGTDPCAERLVNAYDLVRIHLFGELDYEAPEDASPTDLPSYIEMKRFLSDDENVRAEYDNDWTEYEGPQFDDLDADADEDESEDEHEDEEPEEVEARPNDPDMSILKQSRHKAPKFPADVLGGFWADRVKLWAENSAAPVDYPAMALLTGAAAVMGNARWVQPRPGWTEPSVLWCTLIGPPSANKSPAMGALSGIMSDLESSWLPEHHDDLRVWEAEKKRAAVHKRVWETELSEAIETGAEDDEIPGMPPSCVEPPRPIRRRAVMNDATLESMLRTHAGNPRGFLSLRDEMTSWFANLSRYSNGSDRPAWLEAYGGRPYTVDRVKDNGTPIHIRHFSVSILGGIQPDRLLDLLGSADDGLQARFMYVWPENEFVPTSDGIEEDGGALMAFRNLSELEMDEDRHGNPTPVVLPLSKKAWSCFRDWLDDRKINESGANPTLQAAYGKANGLVLRLANVLEHLWWSADLFDQDAPPKRVSLKAIKAAIRLRDDYIKPMQLRAFAHATRSERERDAALLANWILDNRPKVVNVRDTVRAYIFGLNTTKKVVSAVEHLQEIGWLKPIEQTRTSKGGRPRRDYRVNKRVYKLAKLP